MMKNIRLQRDSIQGPTSVVVVFLMIRYDPLPAHDLEDPAVNAIVANFRDVVDFLLGPIFNDNLFRIIQNGSVGDLLHPTSPTVIVHRCVSHVFLSVCEWWSGLGVIYYNF
jgi:hypothetical protein